MAVSTQIRSSFAACFALLLGTAPAFAHHSTAQYDMTNPVTVQGVVERLEKGWTSNTVKPGDVVVRTGGRAKSGARTIRCTTIELATGERLRS